MWTGDHYTVGGVILCCALDKVFRTLLGNKRKSGGLNIFFGAYEPGHIGAIAALYTEVL